MSARVAPEIRLQVLDDSAPDSTFVDIFKVFGAAFGSDSPVWAHMYPPPRPPVEEMAAVGAEQHRMDCADPNIVYVVAWAKSREEEEERMAGVAVWGKPGYRWHDLNPDTMSDAEKYAYQGYNLPFRNAWRGTLQDHRDKLMGPEPYWWVSLTLVNTHADDRAGTSPSSLSTPTYRNSKSAANSSTKGSPGPPKKGSRRCSSRRRRERSCTRAVGSSRRRSFRFAQSTRD